MSVDEQSAVQWDVNDKYIKTYEDLKKYTDEEYEYINDYIKNNSGGIEIAQEAKDISVTIDTELTNMNTVINSMETDSSTAQSNSAESISKSNTALSNANTGTDNANTATISS